MRDYSRAKFMNEVLGLECDSSEKVISQTQLMGACQSHTNLESDLAQTKSKYALRSIGIDWGGGGDESFSYTALAFAGVRHGREEIEIVHLHKFPNSMDPMEEFQRLKRLIIMWAPNFIAHDYGGAGALRETLLLQAGLPLNKLTPFTYVCSPKKQIITYNPPESGYRHSYSLDKTRSIVVLCNMIKAHKVTFPEWESCKEINGVGIKSSLLLDFMNISLERSENPRRSDTLLVRPIPKKSEDIVHAVNYACSSIWHSVRKYPNLADSAKYCVDADLARQMDPAFGKLLDLGDDANELALADEANE